jgi:hypothetical protein
MPHPLVLPLGIHQSGDCIPQGAQCQIYPVVYTMTMSCGRGKKVRKRDMQQDRRQGDVIATIVVAEVSLGLEAKGVMYPFASKQWIFYL